MRALLTLRATDDCAWEQLYQRKLRGQLEKHIEGEPYDYHSENRPQPFSFGNPFPFSKTISEGDTKRLLVASPKQDVLKDIVTGLKEDPEFKLGSMQFEVRSASILTPDVGEPGSEGYIRTETGVLLPLSKHSVDSDKPWGWNNEYNIDHFRTALRETIQYKNHLWDLPEPEDGEELFDHYALWKCRPIELQVTESGRQTLRISKWTLKYTVRDNDHRVTLNNILDTGVGARTSYGLGFCNKIEDGREESDCIESWGAR